MASFFDNPANMQYMGTLGMGLLQASQPQPPGVNRMSYLSNAFANANNNMMQAQLFKMKMDEMNRQRNQENSQQAAMSKLFGGNDPNTGITWDTGRQGLMDSQKLSLMAQAFPQAVGQGMVQTMFPKPMTASNALKTVRDKGSPTGYSYEDLQGHRIPNAPAPKSASGNPTVAGVVAPILTKLAQGKPLTEGEKATLEVYRRMSPLDRMMESQLGSLPQLYDNKPQEPAPQPTEQPKQQSWWDYLFGGSANANTLPDGIPEGSKLVGKAPDGADIYEAPDGKKYKVAQ